MRLYVSSSLLSGIPYYNQLDIFSEVEANLSFAKCPELDIISEFKLITDAFTTCEIGSLDSLNQKEAPL